MAVFFLLSAVCGLLPRSLHYGRDKPKGRAWRSLRSAEDKRERVGRISLPPRGRCRGLPRRKEPTKVLGFAFSLSLALQASSLPEREPLRCAHDTRNTLCLLHYWTDRGLWVIVCVTLL